MASKIRRVFHTSNTRIKLAAAAVSLPKEPVSAPLSQRTSHLPFRDQIRLLKRKVWSLENNKDTINDLKRKNKDTVKILKTKNQLLKVKSKYHPGTYLIPTMRALVGSRQDICSEGASSLFINCG